MGDGARSKAFGAGGPFEAGRAGQTDIGVMAEKGGLVAVSIETMLEVAEAFQLFGGAGELDAKRELFEVPHHDGRADGGTQRFVRRRLHTVHSGRGRCAPSRTKKVATRLSTPEKIT